MRKQFGIWALLLAAVFSLTALEACSQSSQNNTKKTMKLNALNDKEKYVILHKGTEAPFTGEYNEHYESGTYVCKQCDAPLYKSEDKFSSHCGWPSFDDEIKGAVTRVPDADGRRTEIVCSNCGGHLGHVFEGEGFTAKNTRHCVNSISMKFVSNEPTAKTDTAVFASGCFWGTQHYMKQADGVLETRVGYTGGHVDYPSYKEVCTDTTGHAEAIEIVFNPDKVSYEELAKLFFETHDPTQVNRQGPDIGSQYRTAVFYRTEEQKQTAEKLIAILEKKGLKVATTLEKADVFYVAEDYHQNYYDKTGGSPYCHRYIKRF